MTASEYIEQALFTESDPADAARRWDEHLRWSTHSILAEAARDAQSIDHAKRVIFYGVAKPLKENFRIELPPLLDRRTARLLHGVMGIASEAGELIGASAWKGDNRQALVEELGDLFWYIALICQETGISFEEIWQANVAKLRTRYPSGFTRDRAMNRNAELEREALDTGQAQIRG